MLTRMAEIQAAADRTSWSILMGDFNSRPDSPIYRRAASAYFSKTQLSS